MVRSLAVIGVAMAMVSAAQAELLIPAPPQIAAKSWILIDAQTGRVLVENQ